MSIGVSARTSPVKPPIGNRNRKPIANSMGVSNVIEPRHMVASQLNTFTPVGTAMSMVAYMKNSRPAAGMPTVNMWCAHTMNDRIAMLDIAYTIDAKPNSGFRAHVGMISETIPNAGRIMM